jgi:restriction endonuclease Mrr
MYKHARERARQQLVVDGHVAAAISKARTNRDLARLPRRIRQCVSYLKNSLSITSRGARWPETFPKTAICCHLLPFVAAKPLRPFQPLNSIRRRAIDEAIGRMAKRAKWAVDGIVELGETAASEAVRLST